MSRRRRVPAWVWGILGVLVALALWELYKLLGPADGLVLGADPDKTGSGLRILPRTNDRSMPHLWTMVARLAESTSGGSTPPLALTVLQAAAVSLGIALLGWVIGIVVGGLIGLLMQRWRAAEDALLPWVVVSQTVPLIAFAPVVASLGKQLDHDVMPWPEWLSVAVIASYLAFFPVALGMLRGLAAPDRIHLELLRTYAAGHWATLRRLRLPAAVPHLLPALRLAAANAVVGAIVAEVSIGMQGGLGRLLISLAGKASQDPAAPWGPILGCVAIGLIAAWLVAVIGFSLRRYRRKEATA